MEEQMNKRYMMLSLTLALVFAMIATPAFAQDSSWTFTQMQNSATTAGKLTMSAYAVEGGNAQNDVSSEQYDINPGAALAYHPGLAPNVDSGGDRIGLNLAAGFEGSAVISADVTLAAVVQLGNNRSGTAGDQTNPNATATSFYQGVSSENASQTVNFPLVKHNFNGQTTRFYIQAAGSDASVTINYKMDDGSSYDQGGTNGVSISANRMLIFSPADAGVPSECTGNLQARCNIGAATFTSSSGTIVGVVVEKPHSGTPSAFTLSTRGLTSKDQGTKLLAPIIKNNFNGATTGFSVQNVGTGTATVNITLKVTNSPDASLIGQQFTDEVQIAEGAAQVFSPAQNNLGGMPAGTFASATIESTTGQNLVGAVNESKAQGATPGGRAKAVYAAFNITSGSSTATSILTAPLVKERFGGIEGTTGLVVANAGTAPTKLKATYTDANGVTRVFETRAEIEPGAANSFFQVFNNPGDKYVALSGFTNFADLFATKNAVTIESSSGQANCCSCSGIRP
ncbi:hypothetical protein KFU94_13730 [Chloroflexi bacterium TSY]|nr:hypothetical protein [Chloroflexi bacterium TSY]